MDIDKLNEIIRVAVKPHRPMHKICEQIGIDKPAMYDRLKGKTPWRLHELMKLAEICGVPLWTWLQSATGE